MTGTACLIVALIAVRQVDRWWFSPSRNPFRRRQIKSMSHIRRLQRERANNLTPAILASSIWAESAAWCVLLKSANPVFYVVVAVVVALRFRHLQEVTHFAVHGVLTRKLRVGNFLAAAAFQVPLGMTTVADRRRTHVREHHPNATIAGVDPNIQTLAKAGLAPGVGPSGFLLAAFYPLTWAGIFHELRTCFTAVTPGLRVGAWLARKSVPLAIVITLYLLLGWPSMVFGYLLPRFVIYPVFAWFSLLVEHRWFQRAAPTGVPFVDEAARCLRLYRARPLVLAVARLTWLPYGDAFHFAHSVHPAVRWNYLRALDQQLMADVAQFNSVMFGQQSVLATLYREASHESARDWTFTPRAATAK